MKRAIWFLSSFWKYIFEVIHSFEMLLLYIHIDVRCFFFVFFFFFCLGSTILHIKLLWVSVSYWGHAVRSRVDGSKLLVNLKPQDCWSPGSVLEETKTNNYWGSYSQISERSPMVEIWVWLAQRTLFWSKITPKCLSRLGSFR